MAMHLSVNLNKVALLRNARGASNPGPRRAAEVCIDAGAHGLTLHWREDNRHTRAADVREIAALCKERGVEFNLEGDARQELVDLALAVKPTQFTLVPVTPGEITSDHGWDLPRERDVVCAVTKRINDAGIRSAIFVDAVATMMSAAAQAETQRVEIYTEPYAAAFATPNQEVEFERLRACARAAADCGLGVNAGHDLDLRNTPRLARDVPEIVEVSIGHALLADALYMGLSAAVQAYLQAVAGRDIAEIPRTC